jgi:hypothetical protein
VGRNQLVKPIEDFIFSDQRSSGDTEIIYYENPDHYTGYHLVYFVGEGETYADYIADSSLRVEKRVQRLAGKMPVASIPWRK